VKHVLYLFGVLILSLEATPATGLGIPNSEMDYLGASMSDQII
jgi:hypothetical protein